MKRILSTLKQKWPEYLLEMIVITAGIVGAFALNNWNEGRKSKVKEESMLRLIHETLERDVDGPIKIFQRRNQNSNHAVNKMLQKCPADSIEIEGLISTLTFQIDTSPYEQLQSIGMDLIKNDSLSNSILSTFNNLKWYHGQIHDELNYRLKDYIIPFVFQHFEAQLSENDQYDLVPKDYEALKQNPDWVTVLAHRKTVNKSDSLLINYAERDMVFLIEKIEEELNK